ncbi:hypothetical protein EHI8A_010760 [Entamoeba histolytica HM-1:IMSS-B]|uniref:Uncharacterized protein n=5 Tax=Entamoeba histolytica TaxID=5759 RepID=C4M8D9_ENTH1|nr:hypothetical protein EHI_115280 [Entamoeba histolytica HM-1:IMSS]EMD47186.1 Hypothetical protein EHI5A_028550 [Entamoeba histolytica KU27]EMH72134.1 hypothetical protein EHI8A_010760 [Entamoeba histolytica HM-1:IMSS-B]EMS10916.1 hypothetical protein KM1_032890 [Entamoeba histolytica HM-3:IMSS]GAT97862.1 hypothetical protein CL6EHI_115280 [Entamoeba histolytica]EAL44604.1 hypothetical protein EHI_115280 [Entamoeba histolytica HM-1:IMSS]|eukprot:XP_649991.1 hypothetical protein EHI_115280 [Entamoeba histolytica HM-1:IMSS]
MKIYSIFVLSFLIISVSSQAECRGKVCKKLYQQIEQKIINFNKQFDALEAKGRQLMVRYEEEKSDLQLVLDPEARQKIRDVTNNLMTAYKELPKQKDIILREVVRTLRPLAPGLQRRLLRKHGLMYRFAPEYNANLARFMKAKFD